MGKRIKYLTIFYWIMIAFGLYKSAFLTLFMATMATDSPSSTISNAILGGIFGFSVVFIPFVLIPFLAIRELKNYTEKRKLIFNNIFSVIAFIFLCFDIFGLISTMKILAQLQRIPSIYYIIGGLVGLLISLVLFFWQVYTVYKIKTNKEEI